MPQFYKEIKVENKIISGKSDFVNGIFKFDKLPTVTKCNECNTIMMYDSIMNVAIYKHNIICVKCYDKAYYNAVYNNNL